MDCEKVPFYGGSQTGEVCCSARSGQEQGNKQTTKHAQAEPAQLIRALLEGIMQRFALLLSK
jgi:hypothetical protein